MRKAFFRSGTEAEILLREACSRLLPRVQACIISDYAKGVISGAFCRWLVVEAAALGKPVVVDPKSRDLSHYRGATVITPNLRGKTAAAAGEPIHDQTELIRCRRASDAIGSRLRL